MPPSNFGMSDAPPPRVTLAPSDRAWSEVTQTGADSYRIRLEGEFGPAWIAGLCAELANRQISIDRAHAARTYNQTWVAELNVVALAGATDPLTMAYVELAENGVPNASEPLRLLGYRVDETTAHGGTLRLTLE